MEELQDLIDEQDGLISRRQVLAAGYGRHDIARMLRRHEWATVHEGVFANHTGELSWVQRAWAAVLFAWPAALSHDSAMRAVDGPGKRGRDDAVIQVAISARRRVRAPAGVVVHRQTHFAHRVQWNKHPPRIRYEQAVLDCAVDARDDQAAIGVLADAVNGRRTTADRLIQVLGNRKRSPRRVWLTAILRDVASGTCSVLERGYLDRVERPHSLPTGARQVQDKRSGRVMFRDVEYPDHCVIVELDGRMGHSSTPDREADFDRDLDAAADGRRTVRISYGQVFDRPCSTASRIATVLGVTATPCPECGSSDSPGEPEFPLTG